MYERLWSNKIVVPLKVKFVMVKISLLLGDANHCSRVVIEIQQQSLYITIVYIFINLFKCSTY